MDAPELCQVGERDEGWTRHLSQLIVVQVEHTQPVQAGKGGRVYGLDPVLPEVQLLHTGQATEHAPAQLLQEVPAQREDRHRAQPLECGVGHFEYFVVGQPELHELLLLQETPVRQAGGPGQ